MRISVDRFSFEAPQGFEDITNYTFKDRKRQELLTVTFGARPPEARDLHSLLATRRDNLEMVPAPVKVEGEQDTKVDGLPGRMLWFTFEDAGVSYRERWAVALPMPDTYLQISYAALADDEKAAERFAHILSSVVPARKEPPPSSPPDFVRRWAERMSLDVPAALAPPPTYQFTAKDGATLVLSAYSNDPANRPPSEAAEKAQDSARGAELGETQQTYFRGATAEGPILTYSVTSHDAALPPQEEVRRAHLTLAGGIVVHIAGRAPVGSTEMETAFQKLIESVQPSR